MKKLPVLLCLAILPHALYAQMGTCRDKTTLGTFVNCKVQKRSAEKKFEIAARNNKIRDFANQSEPLSLGENSPSLVDTTAASDIASVSTTLSALSSKSRTPNSTDVSTTFSAYGIYAMLRQTSPLDPGLFARKATLRGLSITYADSFPSDQGATADQGSRTYGAKYLIHAGRDLSSSGNTGKRESIIEALKNQISPYAQGVEQIADYMFQRLEPGSKTAADRDSFEKRLASGNFFPGIMDMLDESDFRRIDSIIDRIVPSQLDLEDVSAAVEREVLHASQWSAGFSAKISKGNGTNTYRSEFIHDKPLAAWLKETLNIGWDFQNAQKPGAKNRQVARLALQTETPLNSYSGKTPRIPISLIAAGEGDWGTNGTPIYKAQLKLKVTIFPGVDLPLVGSYVNRTANVPRPDLKGQLNISFDFAKIVKGIKKPV
jgi:hypothetical protein